MVVDPSFSLDESWPSALFPQLSPVTPFKESVSWIQLSKTIKDPNPALLSTECYFSGIGLASTHPGYHHTFHGQHLDH